MTDNIQSAEKQTLMLSKRVNLNIPIANEEKLLYLCSAYLSIKVLILLF